MEETQEKRMTEKNDGPNPFSYNIDKAIERQSKWKLNN